MCRRCWRGQVYCCDWCRLYGKRKKKSRAQRKYRRTKKGILNHREAENRRRHRFSKKDPAPEKKLDDAASTVLPAWCKVFLVDMLNRIFQMFVPVFCHFCGKLGQVVEAFARRGYGNGKNKSEIP
jgi:hypothetical protein